MPARERVARWQEEVARRFGARCEMPRGNRFEATMCASALGTAHLFDISSDLMLLERGNRDVERSNGVFWFTVALQVAGSGVIAQAGREARFGRGDLIMADTNRPYRIRFDGRFRQILLRIESARFAASLPRAADLTAVRVSGRDGLTRLTATFFRSLADHADALNGAGELVAERALDLVALTFGNLVPANGGPRGEQLLRARIKAFIDTQLGDPELAPDTIARQHRISRRYLYRLFEDEGVSVCDFIRERRLSRCAVELADPREAERQISEIAMAWGFGGASQFSRAFRARHGESPRDYRRSRMCERTPSRQG
jgi:AraC-like DNA-binding protein